MVWEDPGIDYTPSCYIEYRCRNCLLKHTNDFLGKLIYGWPPKTAYEPDREEPMTLADALKTLVALLVMAGVMSLLYWLGWVGNENCRPNCY